MKGFNFEKDLTHQKQAVESTIAVFENLQISLPADVNKNYINPFIIWETDIQYKKNIENIQYNNIITEGFKKSNIIDIMMETGTGKPIPIPKQYLNSINCTVSSNLLSLYPLYLLKPELLIF